MGDLYRVRDTRLSRDLAVKTFAERFREHFGLEARAIAPLNHPHICQIVDVGPDDVVTELLDGNPPTGATLIWLLTPPNAFRA